MNTNICITETLFWRRIVGVGEGRFSSKCISFSIFFLVMLWESGWIGGVASCIVDFSLSFYNNIFWIGTLRFNCLKAQCQKLPLSERGRYPKKNLRTCFDWNNCAIFFSAEKIGFVLLTHTYLISFFIMILLICCTHLYLTGSSHAEYRLDHMIMLIKLTWQNHGDN